MPYDLTADPGDLDLQAFLTSQGLWSAAVASVANGYAAGAARRFERLTGREPMLAGTNQSVLLPFDGGVLFELPMPFVEITDVQLNGASVLYRAKPDLAALRHRSIEWIQFEEVLPASRGGIAITGRPGSFLAWPADAYLAVLAGAASDLATDVISAGISGGLTKWKEGDSGESFDHGALTDNIRAWASRFERSVREYRVALVGGGGAC